MGKNNKIKFEDGDLKNRVSKHNKVLNKYLDDAFEKNDMIAIVLKHHYIVEFLMDKLIEATFDKSELFQKKTFSDKIKIIEMLGLDNDDAELRKMLHGINDIRNEFAHNPKFDLFGSRKGWRLIKNMEMKEGKNNVEKFRNACLYLTGYLTTSWSLSSLFPVMSIITCNRKIRRDLWLRKTNAGKVLMRDWWKFMEEERIQHIISSAD